MKGKIFKIKNAEDELVLPVTTTEAVYSEDGKTLNDEIKNINSSLDNIMRKEIVSITDFGAEGNERNDCTNAIQSAIDSIPLNVQGTIYIPDGIYIVNKPIKLKTGITLLGNGIGSIIKVGDSFTGDYLFFTEVDGTQHMNVTIKDLELQGNKNIRCTSVRLNCTYFGRIENCKIFNFGGDGVQILGNEQYSSETCHLMNNIILYNGGHGVTVDGYCRDIHITGGDIGGNKIHGVDWYCQSSSINNVNAIWGNGDNGVYNRGENNQIRVCNIEGNTGFAIYNEGKKLMITSCKFTANKINETNPNAQVSNSSIADKTLIANCAFLNNVTEGVESFEYGIINYGSNTHIGFNYFESDNKVTSTQPYTIVSCEVVS